LALTDIVSDPYPGHSVIPSVCKVTYDRRLLTGETPEQVLGQIKNLSGLKDIQLEAVIAQGSYTTYTGQTLTSDKFFPAWLYPEEDDFVQKALQGVGKAGLSQRTGAYHFCTNAAYTAGIAGIPTIGFGPAGEGDAHVVDERLRLEELFAAASGYQGIIEATLYIPYTASS
jgi:acetylornithine deacetylase/succinyl-diaminopimelate desuccinylase-like protein